MQASVGTNPFLTAVRLVQLFLDGPTRFCNGCEGHFAFERHIFQTETLLECSTPRLASIANQLISVVTLGSASLSRVCQLPAPDFNSNLTLA